MDKFITLSEKDFKELELYGIVAKENQVIVRFFLNNKEITADIFSKEKEFEYILSKQINQLKEIIENQVEYDKNFEKTKLKNQIKQFEKIPRWIRKIFI